MQQAEKKEIIISTRDKKLIKSIIFDVIGDHWSHHSKWGEKKTIKVQST